MKVKIFTVMFLIVSLSASLHSQDKKFIGISGSIQGNQYGILIPMWLGEKFVLAPAIDLKYAEGTGTDIGIGLSPRFYLKNDKTAPYFGLKIGALLNKPSSENEIDTDTKLDLLGGIAFGGEYFLAEKFSFGVELQGNFTKSDDKSNRFGNPGGLNFNTGTMISATLYF